MLPWPPATPDPISCRSPPLLLLLLQCDAYEKCIADHGGIELFLAGIGEDGHIAFSEWWSRGWWSSLCPAAGLPQPPRCAHGRVLSACCTCAQPTCVPACLPAPSLVQADEPGSSLTSRTRVKTLAYGTILANSRFFDNDISKVSIILLILTFTTAR